MASEKFSCSICLDLLKDPVTLPCGHNYCLECIQRHWDVEETKVTFSCPQCRDTFIRKPVLKKNFLLAELVEEQKTRLPAAPGDPAGPGGVACDFCTGTKLRAVKSCLVCLASYCQEHLQPHYQAAAFQKHRLVEPCKELQENLCSAHEEVKKIFCRTDQQSICYLCTMEQHRGHDSVPAAAEREQKQKEAEESRGTLQQTIREREEEVKLLLQQQEAFDVSADEAVDLSQKVFGQMIRLLQERSDEVTRRLRSHQQRAAREVRELQEELQQEVEELKRRDVQLEQLSHTEDHNQFLQGYTSLTALRPSTRSSVIQTPPSRYFEAVTAAVLERAEQLQELLKDSWTDIPERRTEEQLLPAQPEPKTREELQPEPKTREKVQPETKTREELQPETKTREKVQPEPKTREELLRYSTAITLDQNTVNRRLGLSEGDRKVTLMEEVQRYSDHPDRFTGLCRQVLSRESLTGRCYWEVETRGRRGVRVAVAYKSISSDGSSGGLFGSNDKSWALDCNKDSYVFWSNRTRTPFSGPWSSRLGVFLDHSAGILSFYSVSADVTLLHRVQTSFTQPLHAGFNLYYKGTSAEIVRV